MSGRHEIPDDRPVEWPAGLGRPKSIQELIQESIRSQFSMLAQQQGMESFDEADDFDVDDDEGELASPYEMREMPDDKSMRVRAQGDEHGGKGGNVQQGGDGAAGGGAGGPDNGSRAGSVEGNGPGSVDGTQGAPEAGAGAKKQAGGSEPGQPARRLTNT